MIEAVLFIVGGALMGIGVMEWLDRGKPWRACGDTPQQAADFLRDHYGVVAKERVSGRYL